MVLSLISLLMSFQLRADDEKFVRRYTLALLGVVFAWSLMLAGVLFIQVTNQSPKLILPPLERAVSAASFLLLGWAFLTADHQRWRTASNSVVLLLLLVVAIAYAVSGIVWIDLAANNDFNLTIFGLFWTFVLFALPVFGILLTILLFSEIINAPLKFVFFVLAALGAGITLLQYQMAQIVPLGDYMGIFRLTYTLAQVIVPLVVYFLVVEQYEQTINRQQSVPTSTPAPTPRVQRQPAPVEVQPRVSPSDALNAQLLKAMGMIIESGDPMDIPAHAVETVLELLRADVGALLRLQDANYADISVAQDRMMERKLTGMSLNLDNQPTLVNAIERRTQRGLYPDRNVEELDDLYSRLDIEQIGPVYFQPLTHNREIFAILMVAMPYTQRELRDNEIEILKGLGAIAGSLLAVSYNSQEAAKYAEDRIIQAMVEGVAPGTLQDEDVLQARQGVQQKLADARQQIQLLNKQVSDLNFQLDNERTRLASLLGDSAEDLSISQRIIAITDEQLELREERERLQRRLQEAEAALQGAVSSDTDTAMSHLVDTLNHEKDMLEIEKMRLEQQLDELRAQDKSIIPADMQRLLNRMMKEKSDLETEREQLSDKLNDIQRELKELGIGDDVTGLSQWIAALSEERATLTKQNEQLTRERNALLQEREKVSDKINQEKSRDAQILALQEKIEKLASDREVALKQRDKLRNNYEELYATVNALKEHRARLVAQATGYEIELDEAREEQAQLRGQVQELADMRSQLTHARDKLIAENHALTAELEQLLSRVDGDPSRMKAVNEEGVGSLKEMVEDLSKQRDELDRELNQTQKQLADVESQLKLAQAMTTKSNGVLPVYQPKEPELVVGLVQDLRTPMTSISGYVDLLLSETVGILGEMQRKFLQRVGSNISRLDSMIDSLIHLTQLDTGNFRFQPKPLDFVHLVEDAITNASIQFREKGLAVTLDLDDGLPLLPADPDAMKQVIGQLLTNAYLVSPPDSDIHVTVVRKPVRFEDSEPRNSLYVAIQDSGGGISPEDVPRVFARKYKADNPLIQGLGDTGVGLSMAKALIEAHEGQLWVETEEGSGSTFIFAIPLDLVAEKRD